MGWDCYTSTAYGHICCRISWHRMDAVSSLVPEETHSRGYDLWAASSPTGSWFLIAFLRDWWHITITSFICLLRNEVFQTLLATYNRHYWPLHSHPAHGMVQWSDLHLRNRNTDAHSFSMSFKVVATTTMLSPLPPAVPGCQDQMWCPP